LNIFNFSTPDFHQVQRGTSYYQWWIHIIPPTKTLVCKEAGIIQYVLLLIPYGDERAQRWINNMQLCTMHIASTSHYSEVCKVVSIDDRGEVLECSSNGSIFTSVIDMC
jgi:hypothetical protein